MDPIVSSWAPLILFAPLAGVLFIAFAGPRLPRAAASIVGCGSVLVAFVTTVALGAHVWHLGA
ncbi:MAG TPA: hypothetical protein VEJ20_00740, partial [Candidatus Eremiobacteraceae bacterium]|nr:hypothetical protein [Candidatus Eremiobacteraceae bacterium]